MNERADNISLFWKIANRVLAPQHMSRKDASLMYEQLEKATDYVIERERSKNQTSAAKNTL